MQEIPYVETIDFSYCCKQLQQIGQLELLSNRYLIKFNNHISENL